MKKSLIIATIMASMLSTSCSRTAQRAEADDDFNYHVERFADIEVLRYKVPDFDSLSLNQKILVYYLTEAALWGRDILWDQNNADNLAMRDLLEAVYTNYDGDRESADYKAFATVSTTTTAPTSLCRLSAATSSKAASPLFPKVPLPPTPKLL